MSPSQPTYNHAFGVVFIPYQFDGPARPSHARRDRDQVAAQHQKTGLTHIANFEWGFRALTNSRRAVNGPEDVKGMKLRVPPEIQIKAAMESLGAVTATIAFPEVYPALVNKTVDGQDNPVATVYSSKFYEGRTPGAHPACLYTHVARRQRQSLESSTPDQRRIMTEEAVKAGKVARKHVQDKEKWYIAEMEKQGVQTTYPDVAKFRAVMGPAKDASGSTSARPPGTPGRSWWRARGRR